MLTDIYQLKKVSEAKHDLLRTSIAVDGDRVKTVPPSQSPASKCIGAVEPGNGAGTQLRIKSGERVARHVPGPTRRDAAPAVAGVVLSCQGQSRPAPSHPGSGSLLCSIAPLGAGLVARRAPGTGPGPGCDDVGATLHGAVYQCAGGRLCHSRRLEGLGLQPKGVLATVLAGPVGSPGWRDSG